MENVDCKQCSGKMKKTVRSIHNRGAQLIGVILFFVGLGLLFAYPIGTIIGVIIMIAANSLGFKRQKVWECQNCGYFFERT